MAKKIIVIVLALMLGLSAAIADSYTVVYASTPAGNLGELDDQGETENLAGITWDQINEMSQNSPNSLTPIQGLVLWMFMILAFLKLAQKMDSLLQSLGLNVTQTGGRAVGDLLMAGMAIKNIGGMMSRGMGMFGFGRGGSGGGTPGGSGSGTGSSTSSAGGGPTPIPTGSPGGSRPGPTGSGTPGGGTPGGGSPTGGTTPGGAPTGSTPSGSTPSGATPTGTTPTGTTPSSSTSGTTPTDSTATGAATGTGNRNPVGKAVDWMRQEGFAQGAIKAGAKGGIIGLGVYSAKAGASKIGEAVSSRFSDTGISANPDSTLAANSGLPQDGQQPADSGVHSFVNPEEYQDSRPLDGTEDQQPIPTSINSEEYQDTGAFNAYDNTDESSAIPSSYNDEDYNDSASFGSVDDTNPIPTSTCDTDEQDSDSDTDDSGYTASLNMNDGEEWQDSAPANVNEGTPPIPTSINNEDWNDTNPSGIQPGAVATPVTAAAVASTGVQESKPVEPAKGTPSIPAAVNGEGWSETNPSGSPPSLAASAVSPTDGAIPGTPPATVPVSSQQGNTAGVLTPKTETPGTGTPGLKTAQAESIPAQPGTVAAVPQGQSVVAANVDGTTKQDIAAEPLPQGKPVSATGADGAAQHEGTAVSSSVSSVSSVSSESVSIVSESSSATHESATHEGSSEYSGGNNSTEISSGTSANNGSGEVYKSRPMPMNNQTIPADLPQGDNTPISAQSTAAIDTAGGSQISSPDAPLQTDSAPITQLSASAQPDSAVFTASGNAAQPPEVVQSVQTAQTQVTPEPIRMDSSPSSAQVQAAVVTAAASEQPSAVQGNTTVKSQTTNVTNVSETGGTKPGQATSQHTTQVVQSEKQGHTATPPTNAKQNTGNNRPTAKGKSKNSSVKARKRKR